MSDDKFTVLCVDDDPDMLASVSRILRRDGHIVLTTSNPEQALELLAGRPVAVLVSDFEMPEMTGVELCMAARRVRAETVRILLTGRGSVETAMAAINDCGVYKYLTKPWDIYELDRVVAAAHKAHKVPGLYCANAERALFAAKRGFRFLAVGSDLGFLRAGTAAQVKVLKG